MDTNYIKEFLILKENENFLKAANVLGITQSTLSRHIQALENEIGKPLINRSSHSFQVTAAGNAFTVFALTLQEAQKNLVNDLETSQRHSDSFLNIGIVHGLKNYGIIDMLNAFHRENPEIYLNIHNDPGSELVHNLEHNLDDVVFVWEHDGPNISQRSHFYYRDHYVLHIPEGHRLWGKDPVHLSELQNEKIRIRSPQYSRTLINIKQECLELGFDIDLIPEKGYWMSAEESYLYLSPARQIDRIRHTGSYRIAQVTPEISQDLVMRYKAGDLSETTLKLAEFMDNYKPEMRKAAP